MTDGVSEQLLALLAQERRMIRAGELSELPAIAAQKGVLTVRLETAQIPVATMRKIASALQTNAALLTAARDGVKAAVGRLGALRAVREGLSLYTADGTRQTVARTPSGLEHKA